MLFAIDARYAVLAALCSAALAGAVFSCAKGTIEQQSTTGTASPSIEVTTARTAGPVSARPTGRLSLENPASAGSRSAAPPSSCAVCFDDGASDDWLPRAWPNEVSLDGALIDQLVAKAVASDSDTLLLIKNGRIVVERTFDRPRGPIETRSITKSVASLAVLALVADRKIASLDEPLSTFFPEFARGKKAAITLRHVLTHCSGLAHGRRTANRLNQQTDRLAYVRALPVDKAPGSRFSYSNEAAQLLSGVIEHAAGMPLDEYVNQRLFKPIGVRQAHWARDHAGGVQAYYGLRLSARELARIGLLLLNGGRFGEREILPRRLVRAAVAPSASNLSYGLLFWRRSNLLQIENVGTQVPHLSALEGLAGRIFRTEADYFAAMAKLLGSRRYASSAVPHSAASSKLLSICGSPFWFP